MGVPRFRRDRMEKLETLGRRLPINVIGGLVPRAEKLIQQRKTKTAKNNVLAMPVRSVAAMQLAMAA